MKRVLITGTNSYLGNAIAKYLGKRYQIDKISLRDESWKEMSFAGYDTVLHVAGIAHADIGNVSQEIKDLYYQVNCGLTLAVAGKAKEEGVPQFIYFSSVIIYGDGGGFGKEKVITADTVPQPANFYGDSKWQAEQGLRKLCEKHDFSVAVLRLPMIYGEGSKGNFPLLVKLAEKTPVFPKINNHRSMLYVENLAEFVRRLIEQGGGGIFYPQNAEYVTTAQMVQTIGQVRRKKIYLWGFLNPLVGLASHVPGKIGGMVDKAFGSVVIDKSLTDASVAELGEYRIYNFEESVARSVGRECRENR